MVHLLSTHCDRANSLLVDRGYALVIGRAASEPDELTSRLLPAVTAWWHPQQLALHEY